MDPNLDPKTGPQNLEFGPKTGPQKWTPIMDSKKRSKNGPKKRTPKLDPKDGPQKWTPETDPNNGPTNETQKWIPKLDPKNWTLDHRSGLSSGCQDRLHTSAVEKAYT